MFSIGVHDLESHLLGYSPCPPPFLQVQVGQPNEGPFVIQRPNPEHVVWQKLDNN